MCKMEFRFQIELDGNVFFAIYGLPPTLLQCAKMWDFLLIFFLLEMRRFDLFFNIFFSFHFRAVIRVTQLSDLSTFHVHFLRDFLVECVTSFMVSSWAIVCRDCRWIKNWSWVRIPQKIFFFNLHFFGVFFLSNKEKLGEKPGLSTIFIVNYGGFSLISFIIVISKNLSPGYFGTFFIFGKLNLFWS